MGKKSYGRDADGYMVLVPKVQNVSGNSLHTNDNDSVEYWKARCLRAEKEVARLKKDNDRVYELLEESIEDDEEEIRRLERELAEFDDSEYTSDPKPLNCGLGLSFGPDKDPKLYRLSDRDGDLDPHERFVGGEIEVQPGRGFHIGLHWRKK